MTLLIRKLNIESYQCNQLKAALIMFKNSYDDISDLDIDIYHEDIRHLMFLTMLKCKVDGGGFDMIDQLDIRLAQEAEENCAYTIPV